MSLLFDQLKTKGMCSPVFANAGIEQTSIKPEPLNSSPVVVLKHIFYLKNTEQPRISTTQMPITNTNDIQYDDISDVLALQALIKQEPSLCSSLVSESNSIEQAGEVILDWENTEQPGSFKKRRSSPHINESNDSSRNVEINSVSNYDRNKSKRSSLITKRSSSEYRPYKCKLCDKAFKSQSHLSVHQSYHVRNEPFPCPECQMSFICKQHLIDHLFVHSDKRKFQCKQCEKSFQTKTCLTSHELSHSDSKPFQCPHCPKIFKNIKTLTKHVTTHSNKKLYPCDMCVKTFQCKSILSIHRTIHSNNKPFQCKHCKKSFKWKISLTHHEQTHFIPEPFMCHLCDISFPTRITLNRHKQYHSIEKRYSCVMCKESFDLKSELRSHMAVHSEDRSFQNTICEESSKDNNSYGHSENMPYDLDNCDKSFKGNNDVNVYKGSIHKFLQNTSLLSVEKEIEDCPPGMAHETIVGIEFDNIREPIEEQTSIKPEPFNSCLMVVIKQETEDILALKNTEQPKRLTTENQITNTSSTKLIENKYDVITDAIEKLAQIKQKPKNSNFAILEHKLGTQEPSDMSPLENTEQPSSRYRCEHCGRLFKLQRNIFQPQVTDSKDGLFQCNQCGKSLRRKDLKKHERSHAFSEPYQCQLCVKRFRREKPLNVPFYQSKPKRYPCDKCEKSFDLKSLLSSHKDTHWESFPFKCKICEKCFKNPSQLKTHLFCHSENRDKCEKSFTRKIGLRAHIRAVHK